MLTYHKILTTLETQWYFLLWLLESKVGVLLGIKQEKFVQATGKEFTSHTCVSYDTSIYYKREIKRKFENNTFTARPFGTLIT